MIFTFRSDTIGAITGSLCFLHCLATPFLFLAQTCSLYCHENIPAWWSSVDYLFLVISFFAVYWSARTSSKKWIQYALWISWGCLSIVILNEKWHWFPIAEVINYIPPLALVFLHIYNIKIPSPRRSSL